MNNTLALEAREQLELVIIPFWLRMKDNEYGGFYGKVGYDLTCFKKAPKCLVQSNRILWFFSESAMLLEREDCRRASDHAYQFLSNHGFDQQDTGIFWSLSCNGEPEDMTKSSFNFAYGILALSSYYRLTGKKEVLDQALGLYSLLELHFADAYGYKEVLQKDFSEIPNEDLRFSRGDLNGERTMNTLLHLLEAYHALYQIAPDAQLARNIERICNLFLTHVYDPKRKALAIYFDNTMQPVSEYRSFGHEIEASWMLNRCAQKLPEGAELAAIAKTLVEEAYIHAYKNNSLMDETQTPRKRRRRVHWVQAEAVMGFLSAYMNDPEHSKYMDAANSIWDFIQTNMVDTRAQSEWLYMVDENGTITEPYDIVWSWKGPYNNGRLCLELIKRFGN
ncbi:MAG TPA: AGE family epimerase/isomerase [Sphaerochaeta sp.]|nr:AGE family epimerase/isomerase [Sphaerochaeta sp.]